MKTSSGTAERTAVRGWTKNGIVRKGVRSKGTDGIRDMEKTVGSPSRSNGMRIDNVGAWAERPTRGWRHCWLSRQWDRCPVCIRG